MNKVISVLSVLSIVSPALASGTEYKVDTYENYGYAAGASAISGTGLKGGLRGSHVASAHHKENSYYPGYIAVPSTNSK